MVQQRSKEANFRRLKLYKSKKRKKKKNKKEQTLAIAVQRKIIQQCLRNTLQTSKSKDYFKTH